MKLPTVTLKLVQSPLKIGDQPGNIPPNIHESCILADPDGTPVGMFLKTLPDDLQNLVNIADAEIHTDRVPKSTMKRSSGLHNDSADVLQYSTILGSIPPKPHMRGRPRTTAATNTQRRGSRASARGATRRGRPTRSTWRPSRPRGRRSSGRPSWRTAHH